MWSGLSDDSICLYCLRCFLESDTTSGRVRISVISLDSAERASFRHAHKGAVPSVAWSPDGQRIASAGYDTTVQIWNPLNGNDAFVYRDHNRRVSSVAWSPDGQHLASAGAESQIRVWKTV